MQKELQVVNINKIKLGIREFNNQRVITFRDIDMVHERAEGTAKGSFNTNKDKFIENVDYYFVKPKYVKTYEFCTTEINNAGTYLITESGYLMLVKLFTDDLAWKVQSLLVNTYFIAKENTQQYNPLTEKGLEYSKNAISAQNQGEVQSLYYANTFQKLFEIVTQKVGVAL